VPHETVCTSNFMIKVLTDPEIFDSGCLRQLYLCNCWLFGHYAPSWTLPPSSGKKTTQLGLIDKDSFYFV
jgi:hypothetical protein